MQSDRAIGLLARYDSYFRTQRADTATLLRTAQAIRYQVYCLERKFEKACEHDDRLERDAWDGQSIHSVIFHRPTSDAIGTVRLIVPHSNATLPVEQLLRGNGVRAGDCFPQISTAEVSRFAISNEFRRRRCDGVFTTEDMRHKREAECRSNLPCLGLIQDLVRQSLASGVTHWAAVMEPKLLRMLAAMGIHFTTIGPLVSHHGLRQPAYCELNFMLERLRREHPDHWMVVSNGGALLPAAVAQRRAA